MNDRLEIATRLMAASVRQHGDDTRSLKPEDVMQWADELIAEDAKRTEAETRPDRPAKVEGKCKHRFISFLDVGDCIERRCNECGDVVKETPAPRVKWRPASERPQIHYVAIIIRLAGKSKTNGWDTGRDRENICVGCYSGTSFKNDPHEEVPDADVLGWLYASEVLP